MISRQRPKVRTQRSKKNATDALQMRIFAWAPAPSPVTRISVVAIASGNGSFPCSLTMRNWRSGMRKKTPRQPPKNAVMKICQNDTLRPSM